MKRLKDYTVEQISNRNKISAQVLPMQFSDNEATKRVVMHSAKRVIKLHQEELKKLAYK